MLSRMIIASIRGYQLCISPILPGACRFYPTCSAYALQSIHRYGPWRGGIRSLARLLKCHPWHPGGYDPVL